MPTIAEQSRNEAMAHVRRSLTEEERVEQLIAIGKAAERKKRLTTDDVSFNLPPGVNRKVRGPLMHDAADEGFIEKSNPIEYRQSTDPTCNARPKLVWVSLLR